MGTSLTRSQTFTYAPEGWPQSVAVTGYTFPPSGPAEPTQVTYQVGFSYPSVPT
jgi:hypothetical protein